jgi:hypothetical protein
MSESERGTGDLSPQEPSGIANISGVSPIGREESELSPDVALEGIGDSAPDVSKAAEPVVIFDACGPLPGPGAEAFQCTLCMRKFCVQHIDPYLHLCPVARSG